ncbi:hypothetical protein ADUPG1_001504 [Aduncisulcus paluster]|uniref:Uncharacterized protein n=2 Tax=Aduncisulcus paluster TaxID=2918883 RepID=A0ABQ5KGJ7_9EUKA|nr:hypothetical protein ADUPG1_001504 [Aduncisulcus paluster]
MPPLTAVATASTSQPVEMPHEMPTRSIAPVESYTEEEIQDILLQGEFRYIFPRSTTSTAALLACWKRIVLTGSNKVEQRRLMDSVPIEVSLMAASFRDIQGPERAETPLMVYVPNDVVGELARRLPQQVYDMTREIRRRRATALSRLSDNTGRQRWRGNATTQQDTVEEEAEAAVPRTSGIVPLVTPEIRPGDPFIRDEEDGPPTPPQLTQQAPVVGHSEDQISPGSEE